MSETNYKELLFPLPPADGMVMIVCGIVGIIIPGLGLCLDTLLSTSETERKKTQNYITALLYFVCTFIVVGWVCSIIDGVFLIMEGLK